MKTLGLLLSVLLLGACEKDAETLNAPTGDTNAEAHAHGGDAHSHEGNADHRHESSETEAFYGEEAETAEQALSTGPATHHHEEHNHEENSHDQEHSHDDDDHHHADSDDDHQH